MSSIVLSSHLERLREIEIQVQENIDLVQQKKQARKELSVQFTNENLGFLHAVLVNINNEYYAIAGHSGVGKTTYGHRLNKESDGRLLAQDWIAVEKQDGQFFASDLNFGQSLHPKGRVKLSGVILLTTQDTHKRDAFYPTDSEFSRLMNETFDTAAPQEVAILNKFWRQNVASLPLCCVIPARGKNEAYIAQTIARVVESQQQRLESISVGIIGLGSVGTQFATQLGTAPYVERVNLFNRSKQKATGLALDMSHAVPERGKVYVPHQEIEPVFLDSSVVFLTFRDESAPPQNALPERWRKVASNLRVLNEILVSASQVNFGGAVFVVTNPVDFLTYAAYAESQNLPNSLRSFQVYGVGLELDAMRALYYARELDPMLKTEDIRVFGNHSDTFILETPLAAQNNLDVTNSVKGASKQVREFVPRTIYGPASASERTLRAYFEDGSVHATVIQDEAHIGRKINFRNGLPQLSTDPLAVDEYEAILLANKAKIQEYLDQ